MGRVVNRDALIAYTLPVAAIGFGVLMFCRALRELYAAFVLPNPKEGPQ